MRQTMIKEREIIIINRIKGKKRERKINKRKSN
jgi:hypothetical protein